MAKYGTTVTPSFSVTSGTASASTCTHTHRHQLSIQLPSGLYFAPPPRRQLSTSFVSWPSTCTQSSRQPHSWLIVHPLLASRVPRCLPLFEIFGKRRDTCYVLFGVAGGVPEQ